MVQHAADVPVGPRSLDSVQIAFDEERLISDAGLLICATLAERLGLSELVNDSVSLGNGVPGARPAWPQDHDPDPRDARRRGPD
jgi:hypothetical protein